MKVKIDHRSKFVFLLENLLRWSIFTFIYNRSRNMNYFIYTSRRTLYWPVRGTAWLFVVLRYQFGIQWCKSQTPPSEDWKWICVTSEVLFHQAFRVIYRTDCHQFWKESKPKLVLFYFSGADVCKEGAPLGIFRYPSYVQDIMGFVFTYHYLMWCL